VQITPPLVTEPGLFPITGGEIGQINALASIQLRVVQKTPEPRICLGSHCLQLLLRGRSGSKYLMPQSFDLEQSPNLPTARRIPVAACGCLGTTCARELLAKMEIDEDLRREAVMAAILQPGARGPRSRERKEASRVVRAIADVQTADVVQAFVEEVRRSAVVAEAEEVEWMRFHRWQSSRQLLGSCTDPPHHHTSGTPPPAWHHHWRAQWLARFPPALRRRREAYSEEWAWEELERTLKARCFIKIEVTKKPRNITPLPEVLCWVLGPYYAVLDRCVGKHPMMIKGMTVGERDKMIEREMANSPSGTDVTWTDFSSFDSYVREAHMRAEQKWVQELADGAGEGPLVAECLRRLNKLDIRHVDGWDVIVDRERWSGEPGTSTGNALIHGSVCWLGWGFPSMGNGLWKRGAAALWKVEGDDGLHFGRVLARLEAAAGVFGYSLEGKESDIYEADFCGRSFTTAPWLVSQSSPERWVTKFWLSASPPGASGPSGLLRAKALSYLTTDYRTPVLSALCWAAVQRTSGVETARADFAPMRRRLETGTIGVEEAAKASEPPFDACLAEVVCNRTGWHMGDLREWHQEFIDWGYGGSFPKPRAIPRNDAEPFPFQPVY